MEIRKISSMPEAEKCLYDNIIDVGYNVTNDGLPEKLYRCKAKIYRVDGCIVLESYSTPIAMFVINPFAGLQGSMMYDFLRTEYGYTSASQTHICKFKRWLIEQGFYTATTNYIRFTP